MNSLDIMRRYEHVLRCRKKDPRNGEQCELGRFHLNRQHWSPNNLMEYLAFSHLMWPR